MLKKTIDVVIEDTKGEYIPCVWWRTYIILFSLIMRIKKYIYVTMHGFAYSEYFIHKRSAANMYSRQRQTRRCYLSFYNCISNAAPSYLSATNQLDSCRPSYSLCAAKLLHIMHWLWLLFMHIKCKLFINWEYWFVVTPACAIHTLIKCTKFIFVNNVIINLRY